MSIPMISESNWHIVARQLGIPADRAGLVKRNIELKKRLDSAIQSLTIIAETQHDVYHEGTGPFFDCQQPLCVEQRKLIAILKPE